jgi:hypothetical protein
MRLRDHKGLWPSIFMIGGTFLVALAILLIFAHK